VATSQSVQSDITDMDVDTPSTSNPHSEGSNFNHTPGVTPQVNLSLTRDSSSDALTNAFSQISVGPSATASTSASAQSESKSQLSGESIAHTSSTTPYYESMITTQSTS